MKLLLCLPFLLFACSEIPQPDAICACISKGKELNEFSKQLFSKEPTAKDEEKMLLLRNAKNKACKKFETMSGAEMYKRKASCLRN